jgi:hypothetical protein
MYLIPPDVATMPALYVVFNSTGMQESSGGVSPGTSSGCDSQELEDTATRTRNCKGTLLRGVVLDGVRKSSI